MSDKKTNQSSIIAYDEPLLFERSRKGRKGFSLPKNNIKDNPFPSLPNKYLREIKTELPELSEADVVRHFVRLSTWNYNKDAGFYPLGSCTMKYNPKVNEVTASLPVFSKTHPYQRSEACQGNLQIIYELEEYLCEISGMDAATMIPAAGAHGELTGMLMVKAYHEKNGSPRSKVIVPDSAHGTNPASTTLCGYKAVEIKSNSDGLIDPSDVEKIMDEDTAAIMITNPNTLGIFEKDIKKIASIVHSKGGLVYLDGANLNAMMGISRPGDSGVDVMHFNLHKTFSTPHGGGGPGSGPVAVKENLKKYLPVPLVEKKDSTYRLNYNLPDSIGRIKAFLGHFSVLVRAYTYIRELGPEGLKLASEMAVLNSSYIKENLKQYYHLPYGSQTLHEHVFSDKLQNEKDVKTLDIAKRLMDYALHPPTIYFPLIVHGAMMIEPTETESKEECDIFINAMKQIANEVDESPETVKNAPHSTFRLRLDETMAARKPTLVWQKE